MNNIIKIKYLLLFFALVFPLEAVKYNKFDAFGFDWDIFEGMPRKENDLSAMIGAEDPLHASWYAYKFDRTTKEVKCKIVLPKTQMTSETQEAVYKAIPEEFVRINSTFFAKLHNEVGHLGDLWFQQEITDAEYCLRIQELDKRIADLQG